ncbi:LexA family transcriptional regulator [Caminibacter pacificus]|uniref:Phage repressor protein n=1 Tax=Caminibacter pacificus TaxID=1424653 RepID=A0AAJ4RE65_9BACT|nr:LexA family transcriptional regulator [Caminibacter pacificus]NPA87814.1 phage repressor protein [Campylobacterota bacterium]QCI28170.1 phage repressor protein [Caminibacter pacificus]ROR41117.1 phage repressor protein C with HTH and peptisase S24 domain [Caminibacter pacificus]
MNFEKVIEKIKDIISQEIGNKKVLNKDVAKALGITPEHLSILKKRNKIPYEEIAYFCAKRKISINWLLFDQDIETIANETEKFSQIRYFKDINASAGGGAINFDEGYEILYIDKRIIDKNLDAINVIGDSMEPTIKDGSIIFIDRNDKNIRNGGIFVVNTNAGVFVKRVNLKSSGEIELISDNKAYPSETIKPNEIEIVGRVVKIFS